jgi:hypothetical protein
MFRAAYRSSSGALTVFAAFGLHTYVVTGRSQVLLQGCILLVIPTELLLDIYVWLNTFRASSCPSSGAQQLQ